VVALVVMALVSCGVLIALDVRKVAHEKKSERKFEDKTLPKTVPTFAPLRELENN
jgi:hypothetical protein